MIITQRFRTRKDSRGYIVYFEEEGALEMPGISVFIVKLLKEERTRKELITRVRTRFPRSDARREVRDVIQVLRRLDLLSSPSNIVRQLQ